MTLGFGYWTESEQGWPDGIGWIDIGAGIADVGLFVLLGAAGLSYAWMRRPAGGRVVTALGVLTALYLVALAVGVVGDVREGAELTTRLRHPCE